MAGNFVHLHVHTAFSMLDGLATVEQYVDRAKNLGMPALAITDHGVLCGAPSFYHACRGAEIEPIIGEEFYFVTDIEENRNAPRNKKASKDSEEDQPATTGGKNRYHVVILAKGNRGYRVLSELSTEAHRNFYYKPIIDRNTIESLSEKDRSSLVVLSGCAGSIISQLVMARKRDEAADELIWWREQFPNFYMELQHHGTSFDRQLNEGLVQLAKRYTVPWVVTNDPHYVVPEDACYHDVMLAIQTASDVNDPDRFRFDGEGYHLKSKAEMKEAFQVYGKNIASVGIKNSLAIAKECHIRIPEFEKRKWHIPDYPDTKDPNKLLRKLARRGLKAKGLHEDQVYIDRVDHELAIMEEVGIANFLLITMDCIQWAKDQGIPVGPGRGSVCGTLVGYLIGIHKIDPVRYNLLFERFLNPARPRQPDIDTDFGPTRRAELFDYVAEKYGQENVVSVCTYQHMKLKGCFKSLAKSYGISFADANRISKEMDEDAEVAEALPKEVRDEYPDLADQLVRLAGTKRAFSKHPAGVIIAPAKLKIRKLVPEMWLASSKQMAGQFDLEAVEEIGLMKSDFLGLRTLETIAECIRLIKANTGDDIEPDDWVPDEEEGDTEIWKMLAGGNTAGVFQMEGGTNTRGIQEIGCTKFEDVVSCTSLYRTGPIVAGFPKQFIANRKKGIENIDYLDPKLKSILDPTWGVILYQEQVMEIARSLAGFDMAMVDDIKEAIKHKKSDFMKSLKPLFVEGCMGRGTTRGAATAIWKQIEGYSGYCLTGDTLVVRGGTGPHNSTPDITLKELFDTWNSKTAVGKKYRRQGVTLLAYKEGAIRPVRCIDVHSNGVKPIVKITLANGMTIKSTGNHKHYLADGSKLRADRIQEGNSLMVNEGKSLTPQPVKMQKRVLKQPSSIAITQAAEEFPPYCEFCWTKEGRLEIAHLNHDRSNNNRYNLRKLCNTCHKMWDRERRGESPRFRKGYMVGESEVVSIEWLEPEETYCLTMDDPEHNFVANGIVTANSYNRSHAVAYTFITYQTARLKLLYPIEFYSALLRTVSDKEKRDWYLREATSAGIKILPPDINISDKQATPDYTKNAIRFGLADIAGIGEKQADKILLNRPEGGYPNVEAVTEAVRNVGVIKALGKASALKSLGVKSRTQTAEEMLGWVFKDRVKKYRKKYKKALKYPNGEAGTVRIIGEIHNNEKSATKGGRPFCTWTVRCSPSENYKVKLWDGTQRVWSQKKGSIVFIEGEWEPKWENLSVGSASQIKVIKVPMSKKSKL